MPDVLTADQIADALTRLSPDWAAEGESVTRSIEFADFATAVRFVNDLAPYCEDLDHHPDLSLSWRWVHVTLSTHSAHGVTALDVSLAGRVDEVAATLPLA